MATLLVLAAVFICVMIAGIFYPLPIIKPYLKTTKGRSIAFKGYLLLIFLSLIGYFLVNLMMREPTYFEQGIEQLHKSKYIRDRVGDFNSYSFFDKSLVKEPKSPVTFKVDIIGDSITLHLTCTMLKQGDIWKLIKIQQGDTSKTL